MILLLEVVLQIIKQMSEEMASTLKIMKQDRRGFLKVAGVTVAAMTLSGCVESLELVGEEKKKPNIVLFISDDHGWKDSGAYGDSYVRTPNIDHLAGESMRFTHAFADTPETRADRANYYSDVSLMDSILGEVLAAVAKKGIKGDTLGQAKLKVS